MNFRRALVTLFCVLVVPSLAACNSIGATVSDVLPEWAGGLPKDAPPRPGTPEYEEFRRRLEQPPAKADPAEPSAAREERPASRQSGAAQ
jgi:hypothetical protein